MDVTLDGCRWSAGPAAAPLHVIERISSLADLYPDIDRWFSHKVVPGVQVGSRRILLTGDGSFLIAKKEAHERKICTLWVEPKARKTGAASRLLQEAFEWLGTRYPVITVAEEKYSEFYPLLRKHGFNLTQRLPECYRIGSSEYIYNGWLSGSNR